MAVWWESWRGRGGKSAGRNVLRWKRRNVQRNGEEINLKIMMDFPLFSVGFCRTKILRRALWFWLGRMWGLWGWKQNREENGSGEKGFDICAAGSMERLGVALTEQSFPPILWPDFFHSTCLAPPRNVSVPEQLSCTKVLFINNTWHLYV